MVLKSFNAQDCLINLLKKWRRSVDERGQVGTLLAALLKALDCIDHELLMAKF